VISRVSGLGALVIDPWISNLALKIVAALALVAPIWVALRLGLRHRKEQTEQAERDNRTRNLFHQGVPDRDGDRTAELLSDLQTPFVQSDPDEQEMPAPRQ
jgi:hypothetical protein